MELRGAVLYQKKRKKRGRPLSARKLVVHQGVLASPSPTIRVLGSGSGYIVEKWRMSCDSPPTQQCLGRHLDGPLCRWICQLLAPLSASFPEEADGQGLAITQGEAGCSQWCICIVGVVRRPTTPADHFPPASCSTKSPESAGVVSLVESGFVVVSWRHAQGNNQGTPLGTKKKKRPYLRSCRRGCCRLCR